MHPGRISPKSLFIKKSLLPGSGKGLFTKVFVSRGTIIAEYKGTITNWKQVEHDKGRNGYIYYVNKDHVIDARDHKNEPARYANDARGIRRLHNVKNNSCYMIDDKKVFIKAIKNIDPGSEILVGYGKEYWDIMRENKQR